MAHDYVDGQVYKLAHDWMICQPDVALIEEEYTEVEINELIAKFGSVEDGVRTESIDLPEGTEFLKVTDLKDNSKAKTDYDKELRFQIVGTNVFVKLNLKDWVWGTHLNEMLVIA